MHDIDYQQRYDIFPKTLKALTRANKFNLIAPLTDRMDRWGGAKVIRFNTLCKKLIARYGK